MATAFLPVSGHAQQAVSARYENLDRLEQRVAAFAGRGGGNHNPRVDRRLRLSECDALPELLWYGTGETTVLVRCGGPRSWQIYVPVPLDHDRSGAAGNPARTGAVIVTRPVVRGTTLTVADIKLDPSTAVSGGATAIDQVVGKVAVRALNPGEAVRASVLAVPPMVKRGDPVQIKTGTAGIEIAVEGVAEEDGPAGGRVRVRNASTGGRMQAIVAAPGIVVLPGYKNPESGRE